jgi:hypothetical protein
MAEFEDVEYQQPEEDEDPSNVSEEERNAVHRIDFDMNEFPEID